MFNKIKSDFFRRIILSILPSRIELKIIKYNKALKNLIYLSLIDYMNFSGKCVIYGSNGEGKEYNSFYNILIYEGGYKNGERNGKGLEYNRHGEIIFKGEFKNGKRNGKGIEYDRDRKIIFIGEYLNGKKWNGYGNKNNNKKYYQIIDGKGYVNESDIDGIEFYEGEYENGERNGKGREYFDTHLIFVGKYKDGKEWTGIGYDESNQPIFELNNGEGNEIFICDYTGVLEYEILGKYLNGEFNGLGEERCCETEIIYKGQFLNGKKSGKGKEYYDDQLIFEGEYLFGKRKKGIEYVKGIKEYEGEYLLNKKWNGVGYDENGNISYQIKNGNGRVKEYFPNRNIMYENEYKKGKKEGKGTEYHSNGCIKFNGEYKNDKKWNGIGFNNKNELIYELKDGKGYVYEYDDIFENIIFEGEYINGERNGKGKEYEKYDGKTLIFEGEYKDGQRNGKGKKYYSGVFIKYEGEYSKGLKNGKGKEYFTYSRILSYEGEYKDGRKEGKGIEYYINEEIKFEGYFLNGEIWDGIGYEMDSNNYFIIKNGNGYIKEYDEYGNLFFEGEYKNGEKNGEGKEYNNNVLIYEGKFSNGIRIENGKGKEYDSVTNKLIYDGNYLNGKRDGKGKIYFNGVVVFEGEFKNGKRLKGKQYEADGTIFEVEYYDDKIYKKSIYIKKQFNSA